MIPATLPVSHSHTHQFSHFLIGCFPGPWSELELFTFWKTFKKSAVGHASSMLDQPQLPAASGRADAHLVCSPFSAWHCQGQEALVNSSHQVLTEQRQGTRASALAKCPGTYSTPWIHVPSVRRTHSFLGPGHSQPFRCPRPHFCLLP